MAYAGRCASALEHDVGVYRQCSEEYGFDAAIDYKTEDVTARLRVSARHRCVL